MTKKTKMSSEENVQPDSLKEKEEEEEAAEDVASVEDITVLVCIIMFNKIKIHFLI